MWRKEKYHWELDSLIWDQFLKKKIINTSDHKLIFFFWTATKDDYLLQNSICNLEKEYTWSSLKLWEVEKGVLRTCGAVDEDNVHTYSLAKYL